MLRGLSYSKSDLSAGASGLPALLLGIRSTTRQRAGRSAGARCRRQRRHRRRRQRQRQRMRKRQHSKLRSYEKELEDNDRSVDPLIE